MHCSVATSPTMHPIPYLRLWSQITSYWSSRFLGATDDNNHWIAHLKYQLHRHCSELVSLSLNQMRGGEPAEPSVFCLACLSLLSLGGTLYTKKQLSTYSFKKLQALQTPDIKLYATFLCFECSVVSKPSYVNGALISPFFYYWQS